MKSIDKYVLVLVATLALLLAGCGGGSSTPAGPTEEELAAMRAMEMRAAEQTAALQMANTALQTALGALVGTNTQDQIDAASAAHQGLVDAIAAAADVSDTSMYQTAANNAEATITTAQTRYDERVAAEMAEAERIAEEEAAAEAERQRMEAERIAAEEAAAMAATAAKLYAGIGSAPLTATGNGVRTAVYSGTNDADITVTRDPDLTETGSTDVTQVLKATKMMVPDLHGWKGKQYTASGTGVAGTYEAHVYSNVGAATEGDPFNEEYTLLETAAGGVGVGEVGVDTTAAGVPARVASSRFTQTAGKMEFTLPTNTVRVVIPGMYHGVSGNFYCTPTDANTKCSSTVAASGFTLEGGTWAFKPGTPTAKVMSVADTMYASYGWWLHTAEDGTLTASAFMDYKGGDGSAELASAVDTLQGTATYTGGAVGKYALSSTTGGTNDAGHFTARATLEADFGDDTITGTIDQFRDGDGESKAWSVALKEQGVGATGTILGDDGTGTAKMTAWTIDGTAAADSGQWSGQLYENHETSGVPQVATGTFFSEYGTGGRMVGAFGVSEE